MIEIFILIERILDVFFLPIISPPGYEPPPPPDYRPTEKPLRNCISPGLITGILRQSKNPKILIWIAFPGEIRVIFSFYCKRNVAVFDFAPILCAKIPIISSQRRGSNPSSFAVLLGFFTAFQNKWIAV